MKIFANNAILCKGVRKSLLVDTQYNKFYWLDNTLSLDLENTEHIDSILLEYPELEELVIEIPDSLKSNFTPIPLNFSSPDIINNAIIDWGSSSNYDILSFVKELEGLACKFIEFRFYDTFPREQFLEVLAFIHTGIFESINIYIPDSDLTDELLRELEPFSKIKMLIVHSASVSSLQSDFFDVIYTSQTLADESCCGNVSLFYFAPEIKFISESTRFNTCLNKKVSITTSGIVKNCPSLKESYGKYYPGSLSEIVHLAEFTKFYHLRKDEIKVCKDCEFRHVCSDCRAYTVDDEILGKPSKCKYDPYTNEWQ